MFMNVMVLAFYTYLNDYSLYTFPLKCHDITYVVLLL